MGMCFNEAGAMKPRKTCRRSNIEGDNFGFNEAGAMKPRKTAAILEKKTANALLQ